MILVFVIWLCREIVDGVHMKVDFNASWNQDRFRQMYTYAVSIRTQQTKTSGRNVISTVSSCLRKQLWLVRNCFFLLCFFRRCSLVYSRQHLQRMSDWRYKLTARLYRGIGNFLRDGGEKKQYCIGKGLFYGSGYILESVVFSLLRML